MGKSDEPRRLYQQVADQIRASVQAKGLKKGARLPSERDLAQELGVSRPSLREALIALEIEGTVEIRGGSGIYLAMEEPRSADTGPALGESPSELMQARSIVEGSAIILAAGRMTDEALSALKQVLDDMARSVEAGRDPLGEDKAFHLLIARQTGNSVITKIVADLFEERYSPLAARLQDRFGTPGTWSQALEEHQSILEALSQRDPLQAQAAMCRHLEASRRRWLDVQG
ncbi:FadR/GntR family transcriptional regulator [Rhizobium sp. C4]|uniref:FadR/GntR family transcriptional regulator n=1 Tax=Rhizobium sp. C4 TaxID=1349800 RepID=UPI001E52B395|nr:FadR/GntR family transcriptional regulator [Rhizobium sp. C4]MCD2172531.1 FadR family transcriptional regulator [Rhizobium sp. C4]